MSEQIFVGAISKLISGKRNKTKVDEALNNIRLSYGEDMYNLLMSGYMKILDENISGLRQFLTDLVFFIKENKDEKFKISINKVK